MQRHAPHGVTGKPSSAAGVPARDSPAVPHDRRHGDPAAIVTKAGEEPGRQLVQVGQVIGRHRHEAAPVIVEGAALSCG